MFGRSLHEIDLHHPQFRRSGQPVTSAVVRERPVILTSAVPWANDCNQGCVNHLDVSPFLGHWSHISLCLKIWFVKTPDRSNLCDVTKFQANRLMSYDWCDVAKWPRRRLNRAWARLSNKTACSQEWVGWAEWCRGHIVSNSQGDMLSYQVGSSAQTLIRPLFIV